MAKNKPPTYAEIIEQLLQDLDEPIHVDEFIDRFLEIRVPKSKNPRSSVRSNITQEKGRLLVYDADDNVVPLWMAYQGIRFRIILTKKMVFKGLLPMEEFTHYFLPHTKLEEVSFFDQDGSAIDIQTMTVTRKAQSILGDYDQETVYFLVKDWLKKKRARGGDHVLVTIQNYEKKIICIELEPQADIDQSRLDERNRLLSDIFFDLLEQSRHERLYLSEGIPAAYIRLPEKDGYPPVSVSKLIKDDPRMAMRWGDICYSDASPNMFERLVAESEGIPTTPAPEAFTHAEAEQVYQFKAALKYRKSLWRRIEIQGADTLAGFNRILVNAFDHDWDHLGGFWKLIPRGKAKKRTRYRQVDIGTVNPFDEGEGADTPIAGLGLEEGSRLKYVFDFGDWIEHDITLEKIKPPEKGAEYPRIAAQNKPRYKYCQICKENDQKSIATWVCVECSNREQRDVLICEDCLDEHHPEHYADEMVY